MSQKRYTVACLAGHGIGPEVMAQACRVVDAASRLHGFVVDGQHVPFAAEALMRFGHPFPPSSRRAVVEADAVLVPSRAYELLEVELDMCATVERVRFPEGSELTVLAPLRDEAWGWTLERAFALARYSRARVAFVGLDDRWREVAAHVEARHDGLAVEHLGLGDAVYALVFAPERFDVVVCPPEHARNSAEVAACLSDGRVVAWGRLAVDGPSVFGPAHGSAEDIAGQDVADPRSMLLAAALMLGEGLGERPAAATVSSAVARAARTQARPSTTGFGDVVLAQLPLALANSEFYPQVAV
jgi:isocitrate/isopropylmalate dehydrogenase